MSMEKQSKEGGKMHHLKHFPTDIHLNNHQKESANETRDKLFSLEDKGK